MSRLADVAIWEAGLVRGFTRKGRLRNAIAELRSNLGLVPVGFAGDVVEGYESSISALDPRPPSFRRIMMAEGSPHRYSHHNELLLMLEGCAFFVHLVDRLAFRQSSEALRDSCDAPVHDAIQLVSQMIATSEAEVGDTISTDEIFGFINGRALHYANARALIGQGADDESGLVAMAARTITEAVEREAGAASFLRPIVSVALLQRVRDFDWSRMLQDIEANL